MKTTKKLIRYILSIDWRYAFFFIFGGFAIGVYKELLAPIRTQKIVFNYISITSFSIILLFTISLIIVNPIFNSQGYINYVEFARWNLREVVSVVVLCLVTSKKYNSNFAIDSEGSFIKVGAIFASIGLIEYFLANIGVYLNTGMLETNNEGYKFFRAFLGAHNASGGLYMFIAILAYWNVLSRKLNPTYFVLNTSGFLLSGSRTALISFFIIFLVINGYFFKSKLKKILNVSIALLAIFIISSGSVIPRLLNALSSESDYNTLSRFSLWEQSINGFLMSPIIGIGWGNYGFFSPQSYSSGIFTHAHNSFLQILCEGGIIGLLAFLFLGIQIIRRLYLKRCFGVLFAFFGILISSMYEHNLGAPTIMVPVVYIIGINLNKRVLKYEESSYKALKD